MYLFSFRNSSFPLREKRHCVACFLLSFPFFRAAPSPTASRTFSSIKHFFTQPCGSQHIPGWCWKIQKIHFVGHQVSDHVPQFMNGGCQTRAVKNCHTVGMLNNSVKFPRPGISIILSQRALNLIKGKLIDFEYLAYSKKWDQGFVASVHDQNLPCGMANVFCFLILYE
jgi:hypothetical protein